MSKRLFIIVYLTLCMFALAGVGFRTWADWDFLYHLFKPLPALSLTIFFFWERKNKLDWQDIVMSLALLFAFIGDALLMYKGAKWFLMGLGAFLLTHIGYSIVFYKQGGDYLRKRWWIWILLIVYGACFTAFIHQYMAPDEAGMMLLPVAVYALAIVVMTAMAINRYRNVPDKSHQWVLLGALLFVLSDSLLGINHFVLNASSGGLGVLITYYAAQYFITTGYLGALDFEKV